MKNIKSLLAKIGFKKKPRSNKEKKEFDPIVRLSAGMIVAVLVVLLLIVFIIYPTIKSISNIKEEIIVHEKLLSDLNEKNTKLSQAKTQKEKYSDELAKLERSIPNDAEYIKTFKIIEKIAADNTENGNFVLMQMSIGKIEPDQEVVRTARSYRRVEMPISMTFKTDYEGTQKFLTDVKKNLRSFTVEQVVFSAAEKRKDSLLDVSIKLNTIYYSPF